PTAPRSAPERVEHVPRPSQRGTLVASLRSPPATTQCPQRLGAESVCCDDEDGVGNRIRHVDNAKVSADAAPLPRPVPLRRACKCEGGPSQDRCNSARPLRHAIARRCSCQLTRIRYTFARRSYDPT